jgi:Rod binding domain-containing protein
VIAPIAPKLPVDATKSIDAQHEKVAKAAKEFESILTRQILQSAKIGGEKAGGYGSMAVDALADGIAKGGGLGLAPLIERALSEAAHEKK